jgi:hypothetical protein
MGRKTIVKSSQNQNRYASVRQILLGFNIRVGSEQNFKTILLGKIQEFAVYDIRPAFILSRRDIVVRKVVL